MKKIAGVILVIFAIILFGHAIWWSPFNFFVPHATKIDNRISLFNEDTIELNVTSEKLTILPTDEEKLIVVVTGRDLNNVNFHVNREEQTLKIDLHPKWYSFSNTNDLNLMVYVPRTRLMSLTMNATSNVVQIGANKGTKWNIENVKTELIDGTFYLKNAVVNELVYDGTSTDVIVDRVESKQTKIDTFSGNINVNHYIGPLHLSSTSGNIHMQVDKLVGNIKTEMLSGNVNLILPKSASFSLDAELQAGQVKSTYLLKNKKTTVSQTTAVVGSGKYKIDAEIVSGDLIIQ